MSRLHQRILCVAALAGIVTAGRLAADGDDVVEAETGTEEGALTATSDPLEGYDFPLSVTTDGKSVLVGDSVTVTDGNNVVVGSDPDGGGDFRLLITQDGKTIRIGETVTVTDGNNVLVGPNPDGGNDFRLLVTEEGKTVRLTEPVKTVGKAKANKEKTKLLRVVTTADGDFVELDLFGNEAQNLNLVPTDGDDRVRTLYRFDTEDGDVFTFEGKLLEVTDLGKGGKLIEVLAPDGSRVSGLVGETSKKKGRTQGKKESRRDEYSDKRRTYVVEGNIASDGVYAGQGHDEASPDSVNKDSVRHKRELQFKENQIQVLRKQVEALQAAISQMQAKKAELAGSGIRSSNNQSGARRSSGTTRSVRRSSDAEPRTSRSRRRRSTRSVESGPDEPRSVARPSATRARRARGGDIEQIWIEVSSIRRELTEIRRLVERALSTKSSDARRRLPAVPRSRHTSRTPSKLALPVQRSTGVGESGLAPRIPGERPAPIRAPSRGRTRNESRPIPVPESLPALPPSRPVVPDADPEPVSEPAPLLGVPAEPAPPLPAPDLGDDVDPPAADFDEPVENEPEPANDADSDPVELESEDAADDSDLLNF